MRLDLAYYGDPILRKKAQAIEKITDETRQLAQDMIETMYFFKGIGIAAPQVKKSLRLFVTCIEKEDEQGEIHLGPPRVYINPTLHQPSDILIEGVEGCLSIPKVNGAVIRPRSIVVEALDLEGKPFRLECHGYVARCIMHENDHINGVLFIDRMKGKKREELEPQLREVKLRYKPKK